MSEEEKIHKANDEDTLCYRKKLVQLTFLYLFVDILEALDLEIIENIRIEGHRFKFLYISICLIILSLLKWAKNLTIGYFSYSILVDVLTMALKDQKGIELISRIVKCINKNK